MSKTLQNMRDISYAILKEDEDTSAYPLTLIDSLINGAQLSICSGNLTDLLSAGKQQITKWPLPFLYSDKYYTSVQDTYLSTTTSIGATSLSINDTSSFSSTWYLWINEDIITYTGKTSTTFTGVTWVDFAHLSGARVSQLFTLPTDFASSVRVIYNTQIVLSQVDYRDLYLRLNNYHWNYTLNITNSTNSTIERFPRDLPPFYTIISWTYFLPFQLDVSGYMIHQIYEKTPTTLSSWSDTVTIPDAYSEITIPYITVWEILMHRGEEDRWLKIYNFWIAKIMEMYSYYSNQNNESLNWQRITTGKDQILNI